MTANRSEKLRRDGVRLLGLLLALWTAASWAGFKEKKCVLVDLDQGTEVPGGPGQAMKDFRFRAYAECDSCCGGTISYKWYFGDGYTGTGAEVDHFYLVQGGKLASVEFTCSGCSNTEAFGGLCVYVIGGIRITDIGNETWPFSAAEPGRLCFNSITGVHAHVLPEGWSVHDPLIDWKLTVGSYDIEKIGHEDADEYGDIYMNLPVGNWPSNNTAWGTSGGLLKACIDDPDIPEQDDELLTGAISLITEEEEVERFFEEEGYQNPDGNDCVPNWFYYWSYTAAGGYAVTFDPSRPNGCCDYDDAPSYPAYVGYDDNEGYTPPSPGENANEPLDGIDAFAWVCRHEVRHSVKGFPWWGFGGWDANDDGDGDWIPDSEEGPSGSTAGYGGPYLPTQFDTHQNAPDTQPDDCNRYTCLTQDAWNKGDADDDDWAHPGHQWP